MFGAADRIFGNKFGIGKEFDYVINLQGDEPLIEQANIELVIKGVLFDEKADISTLVREIKDIKEAENPNLVKPAAFNEAKVKKGVLKVKLPAKSIVTLQLQ